MKLKKILLGILCVILILYCLLFAISHIAYHRSVTATLFEWVVAKLVPDTTEEEEAARLDALCEEEEPVYVYEEKYTVTRESFDNLDIYTLNESESAPILIYIHGGAYVSEISTFQWRMINIITKKSECETKVIIYPLAPWNTWEDSYTSITEYYAHVCEEYPDRPVFLSGDSAGGGLALGVAENIAAEGYEAPDGLILLSPWVETTETNPDIAAYEEADPLLRSGQLRADAQAWAGDESLEDWHVSPLNGDVSGLKNVNIFVGTREMFYPDNVLLYEKLKDAGVDCTLTVQSGMNHVYPMFPIPEAYKAYRQIAAIINAQ